MHLTADPNPVPAGQASTVTIHGGTSPFTPDVAPPGTSQGTGNPFQVLVPGGVPSGTMITVTVRDSSTPPRNAQVDIEVA